jgi:hypothetical protein
MKNLKFIKDAVIKSLNEEKTSKDFDIRLKCLQTALEQEIDRYNNENLDDRWSDIRQELRRINNYFEDGYFLANKDDVEKQMFDFLKNLDYSNQYSYKKGTKIRLLPKTDSDVPVYKAIGDKVLFRGVSLEDWNRIKNQGHIDSDMRGAILETEGINLGQTPKTALYYLPANKEGIILAISPKNLDLYMLADEYIRVFEPIPIKNVLKVSDVFIKNSMGGLLTTNTEEKVNNIIETLKKMNIDVNC